MESTKHPVSANSDNSNANAIVSELELPRHFLRCSRTHLIVLISRMLSSLIQLNDSTVDRTRPLQLTRFHSRVPPPISVYNYLARLAKYSSLEHCVLLASVYYIDLLSSVFPEFRLDSLTVHRFLLTATTVASKGLCDSFCTNTHYAKVGGVQCSELNVLENDFLTKVNYRILPREKNVFQCTVEHQEHIFSYANIPTNRKHMQGEMNTFNVLEEYYHRMVHLIGDFNASPDKSCCISFRLEPERLPVHQIANKEVARQPDAKPLDRGLSQDNEGKHNEPSGEICSTSTSAPVTKETSRADIFTSAGASATEQVVFQKNRKRNYSESSINHSGPCNQVPISKKHSNSQPKHSPREIV